MRLIDSGPLPETTAPLHNKVFSKSLVGQQTGAKTIAVTLSRMNKQGVTLPHRAEVPVEIRLPEAGQGLGSAFCKLGRYHGLGLSVVSVAAALRLREGVIAMARLAIGAAAPTPRRVVEAEAFLVGNPPTPAVLREAGRLVSAAAEPRASSIRGSPFYKRAVLAPLAERALRLAAARASGRNEGGAT